MRSSPFDLQFASGQLVPLVGLYVGLAHYTACLYWFVVTQQLPTNEDDD